MNKYLVKIPYSYTQYGRLYGTVYAEDQDEAYDLACDHWNLHEEEHEDSDSGDTDYDYAEMEIELEESDIPATEIPSRNSDHIISHLPQLSNHFLEDLPALAAL